MLGVAARYWNMAARHAAHPAWRRLFSMNADSIAAERDRLWAGLNASAVSPGVVVAYLDAAPLIHECVAIEGLHEGHWELRGALPAAASVDEAIHIALGDFGLSGDEVKELKRLLLLPPEDVLPPVPAVEQEQAWLDEADSVDYLTASDWALADSVELPDGLLVHEAAIEVDPSFDDSLERWQCEVMQCPMFTLALEQCCDDGVLLDWTQAATRLSSAPEFVRDYLAAFEKKCPIHVAAHVAHYSYWVVRSERGRRCGWPDWTPRFPMPVQPRQQGRTLILR